MSNIKNLLRGVTAGSLQTAGNMSVIPLIMEPRYQKDNFAPVNKLTFRSPSFGTMDFNNPEDAIGIVPTGYSYIDSKQGQDHSMTSTGLIKPKNNRSFTNAKCVQKSQGGRINSTGSVDFRLLPYHLREYCIKYRTNHSDIGNLWPHITNLNTQMEVSGKDGHIEYFYNKFDQELKTFVAQFEVLPNQVGAIVLIGKEVVGIELTPNSKFWNSVWEQLIRDVYGSLSIYRSKHNTASTYRLPFHTRSTTLAGIRRAVNKALQTQKDFVTDVVDSFISANISTTTDETFRHGNTVLKLETVDNSDLVGQIVLEGVQPVFISISVKRNWAVAQSNRRSYNNRPEFGF